MVKGHGKAPCRVAAEHAVALLSVNGVGPVKLESYGDDLIAFAEQLPGPSEARL